jgi:hypothetical protein
MPLVSTVDTVIRRCINEDYKTDAVIPVGHFVMNF